MYAQLVRISVLMLGVMNCATATAICPNLQQAQASLQEKMNQMINSLYSTSSLLSKNKPASAPSSPPTTSASDYQQPPSPFEAVPYPYPYPPMVFMPPVPTANPPPPIPSVAPPNFFYPNPEPQPAHECYPAPPAPRSPWPQPFNYEFTNVSPYPISQAPYAYQTRPCECYNPPEYSPAPLPFSMKVPSYSPPLQPSPYAPLPYTSPSFPYPAPAYSSHPELVPPPQYS